MHIIFRAFVCDTLEILSLYVKGINIIPLVSEKEKIMKLLRSDCYALSIFVSLFLFVNGFLHSRDFYF